MGHPVIMGRKTHESIGRPLPGRTNIIITQDRGYRAGGCVVVHSLQEALGACGAAGEVFIAGGASVYAEAMPLASRIYLTRVKTVVDGDALFPPIPPDFVVTGRETANDAYQLEFIVYERKAKTDGSTR
jgi:dihydrofolate reductase